jgi:folylpolyglutamate synthase/dihydropteroate synthase
MTQNMFAIQIDAQSIDEKSYYIQVGAFKSVSNIQRVQNRLAEYDIYLQTHKNLQRIQIVNILTKKELKETLAKIRKIFPKAFVAKRPVPNKIKPKKVTKHSEDFTKSFKSQPQKEEYIQSPQPALDSNTILKTRKSFL